MFEGNAQQMWTSLSKLKPLPPATKVFCAHEYTQSNAKFALSIDPDNQALQKRAALINDLRKQVGPCPFDLTSDLCLVSDQGLTQHIFPEFDACLRQESCLRQDIHVLLC